MKIRKIEDISVEESKNVLGGAGYGDECTCDCTCSCDCTCDCPTKENSDEIAGKATTYATNLSLANKAGSYSGTRTGDKAVATMS